jgi:hypothetical protein
VTVGTAVAKIKPLNFWKTPLRIDIMAATDLIIDQLLPRFQEHSSMDADDLAENGRITKYMLSFFPVKRVVFGQGAI